MNSSLNQPVQVPHKALTIGAKQKGLSKGSQRLAVPILLWSSSSCRFFCHFYKKSSYMFKQYAVPSTTISA
jgi:hypothetical protein